MQESCMQRITVSLPDAIVDKLDRLMAESGAKNRSEAVRDLIRSAEASAQRASGEGECVGVLSYIYDHHERQLSSRMTESQHEQGDLIVSLMHAHVNAEDCLEAVFVRGPAKKVIAYGQSVIAEPGVRNGSLNLIPVDSLERCAHPHAHGHSHGSAHEHAHDAPHGDDPSDEVQKA